MFVSLSREFSEYIKAFAVGFTVVQTVSHDVFAGVQSETIWLKIENVSEEKMEMYVRNSQKYRGKRFMSEQVIVSFPREILSQSL